MNSKIPKFWKKLEISRNDETLNKIFEIMHKSLATTWLEPIRVLVDGGIACINIGYATRIINGKFRLFANHSKIIEYCEKSVLLLCHIYYRGNLKI